MIRDSKIKTTEKVLIGFSGGVDSSVAASLLLEQGFDLTALYFDVSEEGNPQALALAKDNAERLGIELVALKLSERFENTVIKHFCEEYELCRTPNPCVFCNPNFKFKVLCEEADRLGCKYIATGHYAKIEPDADGNLHIAKAVNAAKDQSYMLARLSADVINRCIFPLGEFDSKDRIRSIAESLGLSNAHVKDSQDICFIQGDYSEWLRSRKIASQCGFFTDIEGNTIAPSKELFSYTLGQRKGLGISGPYPYYVTEIDPVNRTVKLGRESDLYEDLVEIQDVFSPYGSPDALLGKKLQAKLRYAHKTADAALIKQEGKYFLKFDEGQRAPAPGQEAVVYDENIIVLSGVIA